MLKIFSDIIRALKNHLSPDRASDIDDLIAKTEKENEHATICVALKQQRSSSEDAPSGMPPLFYFYRNYISVRSIFEGDRRDIVFEEYIAIIDDPMEKTKALADKIKKALPKATVESYDRRSFLLSILDQDASDEKQT